MTRVVYDPSQIDFDAPGKHHYQVAFHLDSTWGYSLVPLTVINGLRGSSSTSVVAFGGTHGNEYEGQVAVKRLCEDLDPVEMRGRVILIPQLSETACVANLRVSPQDRVNMNRAFPGNPRGTISYRISNFVKTRILPQVQVVLDIHSGGNEAIFPICASFHPIPDTAQRAEIAKVAQLFDTPFIFLYSSQMASGLLTDEAEAMGKITIGGEFGYAESTNRKGTLHAYEGIKNVLKHYGVLEGAIIKVDPGRPTPPRFVQAVNLEDYIPCPRSGVWEPTIDIGVDVKEGDLLGRLHDFSDHASPAVEIHAHRSGALVMLYFGAVCKKGSTLYVIGQDVKL
jgi:predicted deacylase